MKINNCRGFFTKEHSKLNLRKVAIGTAIIASSFLMGCSSGDVYSESYYDELMNGNSVVQETIIIGEDEPDSSIDNSVDYIEDVFKEYAAINKSSTLYEDFAINMSMEERTSLINYIDSNSILYDYQDVYNTPFVYDKVIAMPTTYANRDMENKVFLNKNDLYEKILENNEAYLDSQDITFYEQLDKQMLMDVVTIITDYVNNHIDHSKVNMNNLLSNLNDLKILKEYTLSNAYLNKELCLIISPDMMDIMSYHNEDENENEFELIIQHETEHIAQIYTEGDELLSYGYAHNFEELSINPNFFLFLIEASAENNTLKSLDDNPLTYHSMIKYLNTMSFVTSINEKNEVNSIADSTYSDDINDLFNIFNATTRDEQINIINMMYSIDIIQTDNSDFVEAIDPSLTISDDDLGKIKSELRVDIFSTLSNVFYKNLAEKVSTDNMTINDVFYLITAYETGLSSHMQYTTDEKFVYNNEFMENYVLLQDQFFQSIASSNSLELTNVVELFNSYSVFDDNGNKNSDLSSFNSDKQEYFEFYFESNSLNSTASIRDTFVIKTNEKSYD